MSPEATPHDARTVRSLASDRSGAVMLMAVFMAVFLTGLLWYAIGIGNAVIYRETMLDGADATAYAAAVYDARGMNIIAMINLIMAAVMAVLVAIKIVQLLVIAANAISCALCVIGVGCPVCAVTSEWEEPIATAVNDVQKVVNEVEPALNKASTVVAIGMPWIAEVRSVAMATSYGPTVHGGLTVAYAQLPGSVAQSVSQGIFGSGDDQKQPMHHVLCRDGTESPTCTWEGGNSTGTTTKSGQPNRSGCCSSHGGILGEGSEIKNEGSAKAGGVTRLGLPVQDDNTAGLCKAAAVILDTLVRDTVGRIPLLGGIFDFVGTLMQTLVNSMPGYFCGGGSPTDIKGAIGTALNTAGLNPAKACTQQNIDKHNTQCAKTTCPSANPNCCVNYGSVAACQQDLKNKTQAADNANDQNGQNAAKGNQATKKIPIKALMGDDDYAVFSIVWSDLGQGPDKGVDLASWGKAKTPPPTLLTKISYAKAEFYYDVGIGEFTFSGGSDKPQKIPADALWNMRWRARLRRMHDPIPQVGTDLANAINARINSLASDLGIPLLVLEAKKVLGPIESWVTHQGDAIDQDINNQVRSWLGPSQVVH
jgi:hypothetical protein